jgi:hypothetical protein
MRPACSVGAAPHSYDPSIPLNSAGQDTILFAGQRLLRRGPFSAAIPRLSGAIKTGNLSADACGGTLFPPAVSLLIGSLSGVVKASQP